LFVPLFNADQPVFIDVLAIVSFGNIFATQKTEAEEFGTTCFFRGEFL
jgi:hypothetical protein